MGESGSWSRKGKSSRQWIWNKRGGDMDLKGRIQKGDSKAESQMVDSTLDKAPEPTLLELRTRVESLQAELAQLRSKQNRFEKSEERFRTLVENISEWIWEIDAEGVYTYVSPKVKEMFGYEPEELIGRSPFGYMPSDEAERVGQFFKERIGNPKPFQDYVSKSLHRDGHIVLLETSGVPIFDVKGQLLGYRGINRDVTRQRHEQEIISSIALASPVGIVFVDSTGQITFANPVAEKILGLSKDEITRRCYNAPEWQITDAEGNPFPDDDLPFQQVMRTRQPVKDVRHAIRWPSGRRVLLSINAAPLLDSEGQAEGMVATVEDITEQLRDRERLIESERRFRNIVHSSLMGTYLYELDERDELILIDANPAADRMTGIRNQDLIGKTIEEAFPNLVGTEIPERYRAAAREGTSWYTSTFVYEDERIKGAYDVYAFQASPGRMVATFLEVTERQRAFKALRESEERFRRLAEHAPDMIFRMRLADGQYEYVSPATADVTGYPVQDWYDRVDLMGDIIPPEWRGVYRDSLEGLTQDKGSSACEFQVIDKTGQTRWLNQRSVLIRSESGEPIAVEGIVTNITEQKETNRQLSFTQFTVDQAKIAVFWCHADGRFFYVNETACQWLQYTREELMQMHVADINPEFPREDWDRHWQEIKAKGMVRMESFHQRRSGEVYPVEIYSNYVQHEGQEYKLAFVNDISERRQAEEELMQYRHHLEDLVQKRTSELKTANQELESFAYSVSHDLRAPLRSMDGFSSAVLEDYADRLDDKGRDYLQRIRGAAKRMGVLIDDLLSLSRVSRSSMACRRVNLTVIARRVVGMLRQQAPQREVEVNIELDMNAFCDPGLMEVVLQNLLGNAWKFTHSQPHPRIRFSCGEQDGETVFEIHDNGAGFDMAYADKLFGVFQRLHGAKEFEGTGIGLATVQRIIQRHGGRIWAQGVVNQGATFYFTIPESKDTMGRKS